MDKITNLNKTIFALATGLGGASIAVIRVSGNESIDIVNKLFGAKDLREVKANTIHFGQLVNHDEELDQVVVSVFKNPGSYTGEDVVEISCHANPFIVNDIFSALLEYGAVMAGPGEFSLRAFLNGKMDLSQTEAVSDLIRAQSDKSRKQSLLQLDGKLSKIVVDIKERLLNTVSLLEMDLDFSEEDLEIIPSEKVINNVNDVLTRIKKILDSYNYGRLLNAGCRLAILGKPNVGKSSLLNELLGENKAIISDIPGTTRDVIEDNLIINNFHFRIADTAGIHSPKDEIESEGILRSKKTAKNADVILLVFDSHTTLDEEDYQLIGKYETNPGIIFVYNKSDLKPSTVFYEAMAKYNYNHVAVSAKSGAGISDLKNMITDVVFKRNPYSSEEIVITNMRHYEALDNARMKLQQAKTAVENGMGYEIVSIDIRASIQELQSIIGEVYSDDILNNIFSQFCIGK